MNIAHEAQFRKSRLSILAAACFVLVAPPDIANALSLADAVRTALANNPTVAAARADADATRAAKREAQAARGPMLEVRESVLRTDSPADAFGLQLQQERFSFPAFSASDPNDPEALTNWSTEVQAVMPVFTGGKLRAGVRQAGAMHEAAVAAGGHTESAVALEAAVAYLQVVLADHFLALARRAEATTARHVGQAEDYFAAGMLVESDLLQARVQLVRMEEHRLHAENGARLARAGLGRVMGIGQDLDHEFDAAPPELPADSIPLATAIARGLAERDDIRAAHEQANAMQFGIARARGELWPELAIGGKLAWNDDRALGFHGEHSTVFATVRWVPWNWGQTQARIAGSRAANTGAVQRERAQRAQVEFEIRAAWLSMSEAAARQRAAARAVTAAERALSILEDRFNEGVARVTEVLDAETLAHEARVRETQARFDLQRALRTIRFASGVTPVPELAEEGTKP